MSAASAQTVVEEGVGTMAPESPVADGVANNKARTTYYKNRHYDVPEGREVGAYYASWGVYGGRDYSPHQVPVERLTHVYVAFGGICGDNPAAYNNGGGLKSSCQDLGKANSNGAYYLSNSLLNRGGSTSLSNGEVSFVDDNWAYWDRKYTNSDGSAYEGEIQGMIDWKNRNPDLKVVWSLGGWSYSRPFFEMTKSAESRKKFIDSVVAWLSDPVMGFVDGVDIDWEFPGGLGADAGVGDASVDGANYVALVKEMRTALDALGAQNGHDYELTTAIGVGPDKLANFGLSANIADMMPYVDRLGLMSYDFAGAWDSKVGFNAAINDGDSPLGVEYVLKLLRDTHGITDFSKVAMGLAFYGRSHGDVVASDPASLVGAPSNGAGPGGTIEDGSFSYFDLYPNYIGPDGKGINGWSAYYYPEYGAGLLWNQSSGQVISFTPPKGIEDSVELAKKYNMRGVFAWTVDDDNGMLLEAVHQAYGHNVTAVQPKDKPYIYAPACDMASGITIKPGMVFSKDGAVYEAKGWVSNCPGVGEAWEQANWTKLGSASDYTVLTGSAGSAAAADTSNAVSNAVVSQPTTPTQTAPETATQPVETSTPATAPTTPPATSTGDTGLATTPATQPPSAAGASTNGVEVWSSSAVYATTGTNVSHNGATWRNKWWTQGEEPGSAQVWEKVSGSANVVQDAGAAQSATPQATGGAATGSVAAWSAATAYSAANTVVTHNGKQWTNKWWTQGEEPGNSPVWEEVASSSAAATGPQAWQSGRAYASAGTVVTHNGKQWTNKWWTQGEEPGVAAAWEAVQ
ncbi:glycosyl hydrolase family 18 protein [Aurantiacibacter flavus]|uniref:chitinase n=1 Tax=Aurantiacibacter flavus TaxID=3145232 RepID=A0ABV0CZH4_9SPHN